MDITEEQIIWFPGIYSGRREEPWVTPIGYFSDEEIVEFVQKRASEDGEWSIENDRVGDNEDKMRKMMAWVSREDNIRQCVLQLRADIVANDDVEMYKPPTVDFVCRDLANGSKWVGGSRD